MQKMLNDNYQKLRKCYTNSEIFKEVRTEPEPEHCHDFIEMVYITNGKAIQHINDTRFKVKSGDLLFINYNSVHAFEPIGKLEYINVGFKMDLLINKVNKYNIIPLMAITSFDELRADDEKLLSFFGNERKELENFFEIMLIENASIKKNKEYILDACLDIIITLVVDKIMIEKEKKDEWSELRKYIEDNLNEKLSLEGLAKKCYYNPTYFSRIFKEKFGVNLSAYLAQKRVEYAKKLLIEGNRIEYIVDKAGFSSKHLFYEQFKKFEKISVTEFRRREKIE